ncbi:MAG: RpiB/LacA/LacB family sugar-phosphate isomerase [Gammaproteobacteria bacterium]|nr:RpiB/LacA/LacB family sugar-phosphate isomerase [Gammaproteobacteria bacterium]
MKEIIAMGCDFCGYEQKLYLKEKLESQGYEIKDLGCGPNDKTLPFFQPAKAVAESIIKGEATKGILICATGMGIGIVANKFKGIYAAICETDYSARMSRKHDNANVLALGAQITAPEMSYEIVQAWLRTEFMEGFSNHEKMLQKKYIDALIEFENKLFSK